MKGLVMDWRKLFRRKRYLINKPFQLAFVFRVQALTVIIIASIFASNLIFFHNLRNRGLDAGLDETHMFFRFVAQQQESMTWLFAGVTAVVLVVMFVGGVLLSHRVAGPLHRLNTHMREVAAGKHARHVRFRKGDYFLELAEAYNQQLDHLHKQMKADDR
jgi:sensor histidine kinase YesM